MATSVTCLLFMHLSLSYLRVQSYPSLHTNVMTTLCLLLTSTSLRVAMQNEHNNSLRSRQHWRHTNALTQIFQGIDSCIFWVTSTLTPTYPRAHMKPREMLYVHCSIRGMHVFWTKTTQLTSKAIMSPTSITYSAANFIQHGNIFSYSHSPWLAPLTSHFLNAQRTSLSVFNG